MTMRTWSLVIRSASSGLIGASSTRTPFGPWRHDLVEHLRLEGLRVDHVGDAPAVVEVEHHADVPELQVEVDERNP